MPYTHSGAVLPRYSLPGVGTAAVCLAWEGESCAKEYYTAELSTLLPPCLLQATSYLTVYLYSFEAQ